MLKKLIVPLLIVGLVAAVAGPAAAKKKKAPKPYTSEDFSTTLAHPVANGQSGSIIGITAQEFLNTCAIPSTNDLDAHVEEVPAPYQKVSSIITVTATAAATYDMDVYVFDAECKQLAAINGDTADVNESGVVPAGAKYFLIHNYVGDPATAHYDLKYFAGFSF